MTLTCQGYSVGLESEEKELPEYQIQKTDERTVTCYIPSQAGKTFSVRYSATERHTHEYKTVRIFADGRRLAGAGSPDNVGECIRYRRVSRESRQSFVFAAVEVVADEGSDIAPIGLSTDVGIIEVQVWPARQQREDKSYLHVEEASAMDSGVKLSERSKILEANHVKPGATEAYALPDFQFSYWSIGDAPCAVFRFVHRPASLLKAKGIVPSLPQTPSSSLSSTSRKTTRPRSEDEEGESSKRRRLHGSPSSGTRLSAKDNRIDRAKRLRIQADTLELEAEIEGEQRKLEGLKEALRELNNEQDTKEGLQSPTNKSTADQVKRLRLQADILELEEHIKEQQVALTDLRAQLPVIDLTGD